MDRVMTPSLTEIELRERIHWLIRLRWLAAAGVAGAAGVVLSLEPPDSHAGATHPALFVLSCGFAIAAYNVLFVLWVRWLERADAVTLGAARLVANVQIAVDLVALVLVLHLAGGVDNPFSLFFVFHMIIASILLSRRAALAQALLASLLYATMVQLEEFGAIAHHHLTALADVGYYGSGQAWIPCSVLAMGLLLAVMVATSITERLREREREAAQLMAEVREKAEQLERAYAELEAVQQLQTQYMRRVAHELRAPLGAIASLLSVVSEGLTGQVPPKQRELVHRVELRLAEMLRLVNDLLTLSRSRHGILTEHVEPVDVGDVIESVAGLQRTRAEAKDITLEVDVPELLPPVRADSEGLTQVMTNLIANAVKYTPGGGRVLVSAQADDSDITVRIKDTGIGIPKEDLGRVFDEFYRSRTAREFEQVGTGLGLAIAKSIVTALSGSIEVESEIGVGTEFTVRLRAYRGDADPSTGPPDHASRVTTAS